MAVYVFIYDIRSGGVDSEKRREELRAKIKQIGDWFELGDSAYAVKTIPDKTTLDLLLLSIRKEVIKGRMDTLAIINGEPQAYQTKGNPCSISGRERNDLTFKEWYLIP